MAEKKVNIELASSEMKLETEEQEIDLLDILRRIISIRKSLYKAAGVGLVIGIIVAFSIPKQYTVTVTLSPEMGNSKGNNGLAGLAASFLGNGAPMTDGVDALNATLSSDIVSSTPFLLELLQMNISQSDKKEIVTLESYLDEESSPWWNYIIGLPGIVIGSVKSLFAEDEKGDVNSVRQGTIELSPKEATRINRLKKSIYASMDKKSAITSVSITLQNPKISAIVADSVVRKLQECIIDYRISKAKDDCDYLEKLFKERQQEYYIAQKKYAIYVDSHDNVILQSARTEQERLQNDMTLAYQVYSQVATQLQVARAKVQEEKPVFAIVEPAVVPLYPSGMGTMMYAVIFIFLAVACTMGWMLVGRSFCSEVKERIDKKSK